MKLVHFDGKRGHFDGFDSFIEIRKGEHESHGQGEESQSVDSGEASFSPLFTCPAISQSCVDRKKPGRVARSQPTGLDGGHNIHAVWTCKLRGLSPNLLGGNRLPPGSAGAASSQLPLGRDWLLPTYRLSCDKQFKSSAQDEKFKFNFESDAAL